MSASDRRRLADLLDPADAWRELASRILVPDYGSSSSQEDGSSFRFLISPRNMRILDQQRHVPSSSPTQVLFDFWSTTGRKKDRPKISDLLSLLIDCKLTRAAKFIAIEVLGLSESEFQSETGCCNSNLNEDWDPIFRPDPSAPSPSLYTNDSLSDCHIVPYSMLAASANNFIEESGSASSGSGSVSHKIGEGAFGSVFKACLPDGKLVAIKVLNKSDLMLTGQQFVNEVSIMRRFRHPNLLPLIAVSTDGPYPCLVYKYMALGSVNRFLHSCPKDLTASKRLHILTGTAAGLAHLHTAFNPPFVHRDVKSDNILLDSDLNPKVGDFGLTRVGSAGTGMTKSRQFTQNVIGTSVYMAPEAFRGDVSVKLDSFAFGVVMLELLTGLKAYDEDREESDLLTLIEDRLEKWVDEDFSGCGDDEKRIVCLLDASVTDWDLETAKRLFVLAKGATNQRKKNRLTVAQILQSLDQLTHQ